jgi:hypothetical protein
VRKLDIEGVTSGGWVNSESHWFSNSDFSSEKIDLRCVNPKVFGDNRIRDLPCQMVGSCHSLLVRRK